MNGAVGSGGARVPETCFLGGVCCAGARVCDLRGPQLPARSRDALASWAVSGLLSGALLLGGYIWVLRSYPALVILSTAALSVPGVVERGFERAYGGALVGAAAVAFVAWRWFHLLSRVEADTGH